MSRWFTWSEHSGDIYTLTSWRRIILVGGQHSLFSIPVGRIQSPEKQTKRFQHTLTSMHTHTHKQTIALVQLQVFMLFILNWTRIPVGCFQETMVFSENWLFSVIHLSRVAFFFNRKLFLSRKDFMFPFSLWNTKPKETQTQSIYINCKYMKRESDKAKLKNK